ncbi:uncharacterized protein ACA1_184760 [Acanthamoeba castellanii str. Neff]|uniref:Uncharacterized protein n=1 Tax=Acanthamoeba castellanii (strain ATCC 30010 / Neff) TaxID=1257118 RepID=L8H6E9_ACACF|nr:uncharacterized protein ACA1_184760 [Acanthamoeba castellanii str. Neff]ELR20323.1 hypothetical protein ACA1_184760 [Acanthamoeba castellanii str. Neff]
MKAQHVRDGVVLLRGVVAPPQQQAVCARFLQAAHRTNLEFLPFAHLFTLRLPRNAASTTTATKTTSSTTEQVEREDEQKEEDDVEVEQEDAEASAGSELADLLAGLSDRLHQSLYGPGGLWASLPENGCSEDHQGRPRSYHRDAHWLLALSFGCEVRMGFHRHDDQDPVELTVPSGDAVLFNGALHSHAVLGIGEAESAPGWWAYPFARAVFLMRDARQTISARRRQQARRAAAVEGGKEAAALAAARLGAAEEL